jgi:chaperonin GroES
MSHLSALHDRIILKQIEETEQFVGGIIIPDAGKERSNFFEVIEVGPGRFNEFTGNVIPMTLKVGDKVIVPKAVVRQVVVDGVEYFVTREVEVEAVLND